MPLNPWVCGTSWLSDFLLAILAGPNGKACVLESNLNHPHGTAGGSAVAALSKTDANEVIATGGNHCMHVLAFNTMAFICQKMVNSHAGCSDLETWHQLQLDVKLVKI